MPNAIKLWQLEATTHMRNHDTPPRLWSERFYPVAGRRGCRKAAEVCPVEWPSQPPPADQIKSNYERIILRMEKMVPVWEKANLTVEEASDYFGIGVNKIRELSDSPNCSFVLWVGTRRLIKRRKFEKYLEEQYSI